MTDEFTSPLHAVTFHGVEVRFCCAECKDRFVDAPAQYVSRLPQFPPALAQQIIAESKNAQKPAKAGAMLDRWMQPVLLVVAGLLAAWLALRIVRRRRRAGT
jgi:YHS domain-containing protein